MPFCNYTNINKSKQFITMLRPQKDIRDIISKMIFVAAMIPIIVGFAVAIWSTSWLSIGIATISIGMAGISIGIAFISYNESEKYQKRESNYLFEEKIAMMYYYMVEFVEDKPKFMLKKINRDIKSAINVKNYVENTQIKELSKIIKQLMKILKEKYFAKKYPQEYRQLEDRLKELKNNISNIL